MPGVTTWYGRTPKDTPIRVYVTYTSKLFVYHLDTVYTITVQTSKDKLLRNLHGLSLKVQMEARH